MDVKLSKILSLIFIHGQLLYGLKIETLEECEKLGKKFCYTGIVPDRHLINEAIKKDASLLKMYNSLKPPYDEVYDYNLRKKRTTIERNERRKRDPSTDCSAVCCSITDTTPPFSYFMDKDGWSQVASTPEFPMRVTFFTEKCSHPNSPCRGVRSTDDDFQAQCEQAEQRHAILLFNRTLGGVQSRYVSIPSGCRCRLVAKNPFKSAEKGRLRRNSANVVDSTEFNNDAEISELNSDGS